MALPRIAIALGDPAGIGPEVALKAALDARVTSVCQPLLVGNRESLRAQAAACAMNPSFRTYADAAQVDWDAPGIRLLDVALLADETVELGEVRAAHGRLAVACARKAIEAALQGEVQAVVAAPQTELAIRQAGIVFDGYPSLVAQCTGIPPENVFLLLCFDNLRIAHVTLHVGLRQAIDLVTRERVCACIHATHRALTSLGVTSPRIAVSGLNPHAGESGMFGDEELRIIEPAMADARAAGLDVDGPFGADTLFQRRDYDAFVVMVHDQGHIVAKLLGENRTAALTIGTPVLFSSVAHGSALDIAGKNQASPEAMIEAVCRLAPLGNGY